MRPVCASVAAPEQVAVGGGVFLYAKRTTVPFTPVQPTTRLGSLTKFFDLNSVAFVTNADGTIKSVVTKIDLLTYLTAAQALA